VVVEVSSRKMPPGYTDFGAAGGVAALPAWPWYSYLCLRLSTLLSCYVWPATRKNSNISTTNRTQRVADGLPWVVFWVVRVVAWVSRSTLTGIA